MWSSLRLQKSFSQQTIMSSANWSSLTSYMMSMSTLNNTLGDKNDRNLINWSIICANDNRSEVNEECLRSNSLPDSRQSQLNEISLDLTTGTDMAFYPQPTIAATVFDNLFAFNETMPPSSDSAIPVYKWPFLLLGLLVFIGGFGNILVCLAIGFERRLQNATNYFLLR